MYSFVISTIQENGSIELQTPSVILARRKGHDFRRYKGLTVFEDPSPGGSRFLSTHVFGLARWYRYEFRVHVGCQDHERSPPTPVSYRRTYDILLQVAAPQRQCSGTFAQYALGAAAAQMVHRAPLVIVLKHLARLPAKYSFVW